MQRDTDWAVCNVYEVIGFAAISSSSGQKIFDSTYPVLKAGRPVILDFTGVKQCYR